MAVTGVGTGINELTALAGTAELVPLSRRGYYIAGMCLTILPFLPSAMYAQMIAAHATWRYIAVVTGVWAFAGLVATVLFYFPPPRARLQGWTEKVGLLKRTDFVGGLLSIVGLAGFEAGILMGGYQVSWFWVCCSRGIEGLTRGSIRGRAQTRWSLWCLGLSPSFCSWCGSAAAPTTPWSRATSARRRAPWP
jgi:hypothetical protein